jgi:hypothetical protein
MILKLVTLETCFLAVIFEKSLEAITEVGSWADRATDVVRRPAAAKLVLKMGFLT